MKKDDWFAIFLVLAVVGVTVGAFISGAYQAEKEGRKEGRKEIRAQAVLEGYGEYRINENGNLEFHWKKK